MLNIELIHSFNMYLFGDLPYARTHPRHLGHLSEQNSKTFCACGSYILDQRIKSISKMDKSQILYATMWRPTSERKVEVKGDQKCLVERGHMTALHRRVRVDLWEGDPRGKTPVNIWGASIPGGAKSWCKSPDTSVCLAQWRNSKEAREDGTECARERVREEVRDNKGTK